MDPRNDETKKDPEPRTEGKEKKRRFQIVKLEERIAPTKGGNGSNNSCYFVCDHKFTDRRFGC
jgi:hypothetical protein